MPPTDYASEAELLAACRRREMRAFEHVYRAHGGMLKSVAFHIIGNRQDAEDAVQEAFLKFHRAVGGFQGNSTLRTWLCRIVINASYDLARKRRREVETPPDRPAATQISLRVALDDALRRIHPQHRMVFVLFEVEGLRHSEIAGILEIPEGTSKAWLFEAKKELKRLLLTEASRR